MDFGVYLVISTKTFDANYNEESGRVSWIWPCDMILVSELRVYNVESYVRGLIL